MATSGSFRVRVPLTLAATAGASALILALVIAVQTYLNVKEDLATQGRQLGRAMAPALTSALRHDDVWLAYTILRGSAGPPGSRRPSLVLVDRTGRIFAANEPRHYPTARPLSEAAPSLAAALREPVAGDAEEMGSPASEAFIQRVPLITDTVTMGNLLVSYPPQAYWNRFWAIIGQGAVYTAGIMLLSAVAGVYLGRRLVRPLTQLAGCMGRVGREPLQAIQCSTLPAGDDELGRLAAAFQQMLRDLEEKEQLERQMVSSERLAAVGRLAAGVAHEINNPLGGMLVALDTLRTHGNPDPRTLHTLHQLERGLEQIRETVSALLLEARREPRSLTPQDLEDVRTLVVSQRPGDSVRLTWDNRVRETLGLPSTLVRQVLLNLLLNAVQAAGEGGGVVCRMEQNAYALLVQVENESETMRPEVLDRLFEPYVSAHGEGRGLGLWVTYQIVRQLQGSVVAESEDGWTRFRVQLPLLEEQADEHAVS